MITLKCIQSRLKVITFSFIVVFFIFKSNETKFSLCWSTEPTSAASITLYVSKWDMVSDRSDWLLYLPPCGVRISLQQLDKISCLKTERRLPWRCWSAMVVPHCHHLRTCKHKQVCAVSVNRGTYKNLARWLMQWSKIHATKPQHPAFKSDPGSLLHGVPYTVHLRQKCQKLCRKCYLVQLCNFKLFLTPQCRPIYDFCRPSIMSLLSQRSSSFWISSNGHWWGNLA